MYALGIDFGGGSSKATLINERGEEVATASSEYPTYYGDGGKAEQNPYDWYNAACKNIRKILGVVRAEEIACICFDAATHTAVLTDENFVPVMNAVYWTDTRSVAEKEFLAANFGEEIFEKCKHYPDTIWSLPEILYIKNARPEVFSRVKKVTFAKDFVRRLFTGDFITDFIEAQGSMLADFDKKAWDGRLLSVAGLAEDCMPEIRNPLAAAGTVCGKAAQDTGLSRNTKVICGSTDTVMELFAAGAVNRGDMTVKLATAGRICVVSDSYFPDRNIINYSHLKEGLYYPGSATKSCAASLRWFRDAFGGDFSSFSSEAASVPVGSGGLIFHPYLTGELTPYANPLLKGGFTGISANHSKAHFVRSIMEGVALSLLDCKNYLSARGVYQGGSACIIGGGAKSDIWRQITADVLGLDVYTVGSGESSYGSAMCAAIACGFFKDFDDAARSCAKVEETTVHNAENTAVYSDIYVRYKKISQFYSELFNEK